MAGGDNPNNSPPVTANMEIYDGSSWTESTDIPTAHTGGFMVGTTTAAVSFGGWTSPSPGEWLSASNEWNGSSWTAGGTLNYVTAYGGDGGASATDCYKFGGYSPSWGNIDNNEAYDGTSFATSANMSNARSGFGGAGTASTALLAGSWYNGNTATEEFSGVTSAAEASDIDFD